MDVTDTNAWRRNEWPQQPQERTIRVAAMPLWRKREIAMGIVRGALRHRLAGMRCFPIIHARVRVRSANGTVRVGNCSEIHEGVVLSAIGRAGDPPATLSIGDYTSVWYGTVISARREITIGRHCAISWNCTIIDDDMHEILRVAPNQHGQRERGGVIIEDHVWIGAAAIILKGVRVGENSIVAAGSVVTRDVPPHTLVAGAPAQPIRLIAGWH